MADTDQLRDHAFDGITEYDNDLPRWWLALLWCCVVFAVLYVGWWHFGGGQLGAEALVAEKRAIAAARVADATGPLPEDALRQLSHDPARRAHGKELFQKSQCVTCHGFEATGIVGPNLRDDFWIYGSDMSTIVETITKGRANGIMPPQEKNLSRDEIIDLAVFVAAQNRDSKAPGKTPDPTREKKQPIAY